ncbi:MAG TPA: amidohydrolase family protein [Chloroflexota bacterium]|nr:amidohydrolase family protein [Chloroflexota bacterium]
MATLTGDYNTNLLLYPTIEEKIWGPADLLELEDRAGIQRAVIVPACTLWPDNEGLAKAIREYPRFSGCAIVNPHFGEKAVQELERCVVDRGIKGLKLMPTFHGYAVDSELVDPLMGKARELGIPVTAHSGSWNAHPLQIAALAERYPEVPIIMEHSGYRWYLRDAITAAQHCPNIYLGLSIIATETVMIPTIFKAVGPNRMVFGSDAPSAYPDLAAEAIRRLKFGAEAEALIFGGVLGRIYRWEE